MESEDKQPASEARKAAFEADAAAFKLARGQGAVDLALGELLVRLEDTGGLIVLGYSNVGDYAREELGLPARTAYFLVELARGCFTRPVLRAAIRAGVVSPRKAYTVLPLAVGDSEIEWTKLAGTRTLKELTWAVKAAGKEVKRDLFDADVLWIRMTPEQQDRLDRAYTVAYVVFGGRAPKWMCDEAMAMEFLSSFPEFMPDGKGKAEDPQLPERAARAPEVRTQTAAVDAAREEITERDPMALNRKVKELEKARKEFDLPLGKVLNEVVAKKSWKEIGYGSLDEYAEERLGTSGRAVRQRAWLHGQCEVFPEIEGEMKKGELPFARALLVARGATPENVRERIREAKRKSTLEMEREAGKRRERKERARGVSSVWGPKEATEVIALGITTAQAYFGSLGEEIDAGEARARIADHFALVWGTHIESSRRARHLKKRTPEELVEEMLARNYGFCEVPKCSRAARHRHHLKYRSQGGGDEETNVCYLCACHHLRGIHDGYLKVTGKGGEELVWKFGPTGEEPIEVWRSDEVGRAVRVT